MKTGDDYFKTPIVSVLIPTRNRVEKLKRCLDSLYSNANNPALVEVILRVASDDEATMLSLSGLIQSFPNVRAVVGWQMDGMMSIAQFNDEAARLARGKFIWLFSDDAWVEGKLWDLTLDKSRIGESNVVYYAQFEGNGNSTYEHHIGGPFPIIPKKMWFDCGLGKHRDYAIDIVVRDNPTVVAFQFLPGIKVGHVRDADEIARRDVEVKNSTLRA